MNKQTRSEIPGGFFLLQIPVATTGRRYIVKNDSDCIAYPHPDRHKVTVKGALPYDQYDPFPGNDRDCTIYLSACPGHGRGCGQPG